MRKKFIGSTGYPAEAFALVLEADDPSSWHGCFWANADGLVTKDSVQAAQDRFDTLPIVKAAMQDDQESEKGDDAKDKPAPKLSKKKKALVEEAKKKLREAFAAAAAKKTPEPTAKSGCSDGAAGGKKDDKYKKKTVREIQVTEKAIPVIDERKVRSLLGLTDDAPLPSYTIDEQYNSFSCGDCRVPLRVVAKADEPDADDAQHEDGGEGVRLAVALPGEIDALREPGLMPPDTFKSVSLDASAKRITMQRRPQAAFDDASTLTASMAPGVTVRMGVLKDATDLLCAQAYEFDTAHFATPGLCEAWLMARKDLFTQQAFDPDWLPTTSLAQPYTLVAHTVTPLTYKEQGLPLSALRDSHGVVSDVRLGGNGACYGFRTLAPIDNLATPFIATLRGAAPLWGLQTASDKSGIEIRKVSGNYPPISTYEKHVQLDAGQCAVRWATPTMLAGVWRSAGSDDLHVLNARATEIGWLLAREKAETPAPSLTQLAAENVPWAMLTERENATIIDVTKHAGRLPGFAVVTKAANPALRYTLGVVYPANDLDVHKDYATQDQLERTAWNYLTQSREIGLFHKSGTAGHGTVVESYIYRGPDWTVGAKQVVKSGDWLMGVVWNEDAWKQIEKGDVKGYSLQGLSRRVLASPTTTS